MRLVETTSRIRFVVLKLDLFLDFESVLCDLLSWQAAFGWVS